MWGDLMPKAKFKTDQEWLDVIQTCRTSGMTDKDWCRSNGISQTSLYRHINRLRKKDYAIPEHGRVQLDKGHEVVPVEFDKITELDPKYVRLSSEVRSDDISVSGIASSGVHVTAGKFKIDIDNNVNASVLQDTLRILQRLC
jgi:hypothetical protein